MAYLINTFLFWYIVINASFLFSSIDEILFLVSVYLLILALTFSGLSLLIKLL